MSLHPHNDRGCSIAAAELGQMAGAQRVEGCLFGNGERAGNVDLVILALNLYSQGIDPGIDFSNLPTIRALVEECTNIKVHPRQPYSGDLVFMAYSGAHQDAIGKGLTKMRKQSGKGSSHGHNLWKVPYLAMDPQDLGSTYEAVIRLNSQSGKGGVAWTLSHQLQIQLPKGLQVQFSKVVKKASEDTGGVVSPDEMTDLFLKRYFISEPDPRILSANIGKLDQYSAAEQIAAEKHNGHAQNGSKRRKINGAAANGKSISKTIDTVIKVKGKEERLRHEGSDITSAIQSALAILISDVTFHQYVCNMQSSDEESAALLVVECRSSEKHESTWGARLKKDDEVAELFATLSSALVR